MDKLQRIEPSDTCCVCMDENNRNFMFKTCCSVLLCRSCYNQLEVEAFPGRNSCPGCRTTFNKIGYSVKVVDNIAVPRAYCGVVLTDVKSLKEHDEHVLSCADCLRKVIAGQRWFEGQLTEKFAGMKRKLQSVEDEVYVRNHQIRNLTSENRHLMGELTQIIAVMSGRERPRPVLPAESVTVTSSASVSSTEVFSSEEEQQQSAESAESVSDENQTPPRQRQRSTPSAARTRAPPVPRARPSATLTVRPRNNRGRRILETTSSTSQ